MNGRTPLNVGRRRPFVLIIITKMQFICPKLTPYRLFSPLQLPCLLGRRGIQTLQVVPSTNTYFTSNVPFHTIYLRLEELLHSCRPWVFAAPEHVPLPKWKSLEEYRREFHDTKTNTLEYRRITNILNELNRLSSEFRPSYVDEVLNMFRSETTAAGSVLTEKTPDHLGCSSARGLRKSSRSSVRMVPGHGLIYVNGVPIHQYFGRLHDRKHVLEPLVYTGRILSYNVWALVRGGGTTGQAGAVRTGICHALLIQEPDLKPILRANKCVTYDVRRVERKKTGQPKARKKYTWVKR
ncbi:mitochondrial 37S ribosomal protein MRPS9 [Schizosaccharomyces japonicus yFS275]|uniref:Small ribosomal subunit protein uS9m n=1 Tax=Schizosaccharomyces japonicus (strain yFS275 / FY16936) TaxID=402676 RepID=B6K7N6_SCHJY|nr:mitochondrial 37S ribosomal protein MRPS9 [Schizosaccharomyces japonicus yFS275]EEB09540.1 ribosomal protein subunit S9 [Schizosaccharomyces japonicus yFS275]